MINYYKELGVSKNASLQEIKSAYLKQLKKYHPDIYDGDENFAQEKTAILNECYNTLKDEKLRTEYDKKLFGLPTVVSENKNVIKPKKENIFKEFTKNLKINLGSEKNQKNKSTNKTKIKQQKVAINNKTEKQKTQNIKLQKISKFITEEDINKKEKQERIKLSGSILLIILIIIGIILLFLFL